MHPFAALFDVPADEGFLAREILDHLDREAAQPEVLPMEASANLVILALLATKMDRKVTLEKGVCAINRMHRDRHVVEAHPDTFNHVKFLLLSRTSRRKCAAGVS